MAPQGEPDSSSRIDSLTGTHRAVAQRRNSSFCVTTPSSWCPEERRTSPQAAANSPVPTRAHRKPPGADAMAPSTVEASTREEIIGGAGHVRDRAVLRAVVAGGQFDECRDHQMSAPVRQIDDSDVVG